MGVAFKLQRGLAMECSGIYWGLHDGLWIRVAHLSGVSVPQQTEIIKGKGKGKAALGVLGKGKGKGKDKGKATRSKADKGNGKDKDKVKKKA